MTTLRLILGDQLSHTISSLEGYDKAGDVLLMCEVREEATCVKHHKKKIAFLFSAMRHFAAELQRRGYNVSYTRLDDEDNAGSFGGEVERALKRYDADKIIVTHPGEYRVLQEVLSWEKRLGIPLEVRVDSRFMCAPDEFAAWAGNRKRLRMEYFYREMRRKHSILMQGDEPMGGQWNYDAENRKPPQRGLHVPPTYGTKPDAITRDVMRLVAARFGDHFGDLKPFHFAVTRAQALAALGQFIEQRLGCFGDYQDAMLQDEPWMYHSHVSFYLNCGLLLPMECVRAAARAYEDKKAPLNAVEGFIRQVLGWREYIHGIYWLAMPDYAKRNFFGADKKLPDFYWTGNTRMNCLRQCVLATRQNAYAHHIQRLMVLGNFALLAGIDPAEVNEWFLVVYADAYEWVELPNVSGMILFADGGYLASKPYAAGGGYINKMSDYCKACTYHVSKKHGPDACPFNYLYWNFLARNRDKLASNHRVGMMYRTYDRMSDDKKLAIERDSRTFLASMTR